MRTKSTRMRITRESYERAQRCARDAGVRIHSIMEAALVEFLDRAEKRGRLVFPMSRERRRKVGAS